MDYQVKSTNPAFERAMEEQKLLAKLAEEEAKQRAIKRFTLDGSKTYRKVVEPRWSQETFEKRKRRKKLADKSRARNR